MTDKQAHIEQKEVMVDVCSECGEEEPICDSEKCNDRKLEDGESFVCVDNGDFHFCKKCSKLSKQGAK